MEPNIVLFFANVSFLKHNNHRSPQAAAFDKMSVGDLSNDKDSSRLRVTGFK